MLGGTWALLILDLIGGCALAVGVITLWHRSARQRMKRF
jgi:hypothetical protein